VTSDVWITKDGRRIPVKEMSDEHIVNTIRMLRRKGGVTVDEFLGMCVAVASVNGEMAQYAAEGEIADARVLPPVFDALLDEASARGLEIPS
jgi:hypothetical protein